jgi:hypothetical protein
VCLQHTATTVSTYRWVLGFLKGAVKVTFAMKVQIKRDPLIRAAFEKLTNSVDTATGVRRRLESLDTLKARIPLEDVVAQYLEEEPEPTGNELRFHCPERWHGRVDVNPSFWVNPEKQRFGCNSCGMRSGDVVDFIRKALAPCTQAEAEAHLRAWDHNHNQSDRSMKIRVRRSR